MTISVNVMPALGVVQIVDLDDGNFILLRRNECSQFLATFMDAMADSMPDSGSHSRHHSLLPDVDGYEMGSAKADHLRLVESGER